jgi:hypothetical protein
VRLPRRGDHGHDGKRHFQEEQLRPLGNVANDRAPADAISFRTCSVRTGSR